MKISIIMPVYNAKKYLKESINSVLTQDLVDIELICIDDGSTDNSLNILKEMKSIDNRVVVLKQKNSGSGLARNKAIKNAQGEFIAFMDSDDWYPSKDVLSTLFYKAKEYNQKIVGGSFVRYYENGKIESEFSGVYSAYKFEKDEVIPFGSYQFDYGYHRFLYNRQMIIDNNIYFPDYRRFQDPPFFLRAMIASSSFYSVNKAVYAYRKGHQVIEWDIEKIKGLLTGLLENLVISKKKKFEKLHYLIIDRIENDFFKIIKGNFENSLVFYLIKRFIYSIDEELAQKYKKEFKLKNMKTYKLLKELESK